MAWVSEDWDELGSFLNRGLRAYTSERQRRQENEWREVESAGAQAKTDAYIAMLNEQMGASQERRSADREAAERLRTPVGAAGWDEPEDVPLGELGAYGQYMEGQEIPYEEQEVNPAVSQFLEGIDTTGLTNADIRAMSPFILEQIRADRQAGLGKEGEGGYSDMPAAMLKERGAVEERFRMQALMGFARQDEDLMEVVLGATHEMTGEFDWRKIEAALSEEQAAQLKTASQYLTDTYIRNKGFKPTPGMELRELRRMILAQQAAEPTEEEKIIQAQQEQEAIAAEGMGRMPTREDYVGYMQQAHPSLGAPGPGAAANIRALAEDPEALGWIGMDRYQSKGDWVSGIESAQQEARATGKQWGWAPSFGEETRATQARRKMLEEVRRRSRQAASPIMRPLQ